MKAIAQARGGVLPPTPDHGVKYVARSITVVFLFALLSAPPAIRRLVGGDTRAFVVATILFGIGAATFALLSEADEHTAKTVAHPSRAIAVVIAVIAVAALFAICGRWLQQIFTIPIDAFAADMLVVIREGLRRAAQGHNPYTIYHVPWAAPLPYGPLLWGPYAVPMVLRVDLRFLSVAGALFFPVACAVAAVIAASRRHAMATSSCIVLLAAIGFDPDLHRFTTTAHTPVYWPLLALFAWFVVERRWRAASIALGLLVVARSTMVALVPVLLMTAWQQDRRTFRQALGLLLLAIGLPLLPFALWDWRALTYALYGSYEAVIKSVVWPDPTVPHTIGVTGILLSHHMPGWVEPIQAGVMLAVYAVSWFALRRRRAPLAIMSMSLVVFSMTTLWPVYYIYFDPLLLMAASIVADTLKPPSEPWSGTMFRQWGFACVSAVALVIITAAVLLRSMPDGPTSIVNRQAPPMSSVRILRRTPGDSALADIQFGAGPRPDTHNMSMTLNDVPFTPAIAQGDDRIFVAVPGSLWQVGLNKMDLRFASPAFVVRSSLLVARNNPSRIPK